MVAALLQSIDGLFLRAVRGAAYDGDAPADQLFIGGLHVHHQVPIDLAQLDHGPGGEHIEHHLLGCAGLHAGGAGDHLRAGGRGDANVGEAVQNAAGAAGDGNGGGSQLLCILHAAQHIGGAAAGGNAHQHILAGESNALHVGFPQLLAVLGTLNGLKDGAVAAGHQGLDGFRVCGVGRGALHRVQNAKSAGGAGSAVDQAAAGAQAGGDHVHSLGNFVGHQGNGLGHPVILPVDELHHIQCGQGVDVHGVGVALLRGDLL